MQFLPMSSTSGSTSAMCQALSTPLSFWEFQRKNSNAKTSSSSVVSPCKARISQILADGVIIDNLDKENNTAKLSCLSASNVSFTIKCSPVDTEALRDVTKTPKAGSGNVFLANDCLVALCPIEEGAELFVDAATLDAQLFMDLPEESRIKLVGFTEPSLRAYLSSEVKMPVQSVCPKLDVRRSEAIGEALRAISKVEVGETLYNFEKDKMSILPFATMYTICVSNGVHMLVDGGSQCLAHSCDPNTHIVIDDVAGSLKVVAVKEISPDDIVSFNYLTTEWDMDCAFECACGSDKCFGKIAGFRHLAKDKQDILLQDPKAFGLSPIVATLAAAQRAGASHPAVATRATADFSRGAIITVKATESNVEVAAGSSNEITAETLKSAAKCFRDGTGYCKVQDVSVDELAQNFFASSSDEKQEEPSSSPSFVAPCACRIGQSIVALRDIPKGEEITVRNIIPLTPSSKSAASSSLSIIDEESALKMNAHVINILVAEGEQQEQEASATTVFTNSSIQSHKVTVQKDQETAGVEAAIKLAHDVKKDDLSLQRGSFIVVVDQQQQKNIGMLVSAAVDSLAPRQKETACC